MNTTVNELKELYESLGGTPSDVAGITTIPDMIAALAEVAGTTIELPAVSSTDNGDVLTVVSGKWAKADPPTELPAVSSADNGKILGVSGGEWRKVVNDIPVRGKYTVTWANISADGGYTVPNSELDGAVLAAGVGNYQNVMVGLTISGESAPARAANVEITYADGNGDGHGSVVVGEYKITVDADSEGAGVKVTAVGA